MIKIFTDTHNVDLAAKWIYMYISTLLVPSFPVGDRPSGEWFPSVWTQSLPPVLPPGPSASSYRWGGTSVAPAASHGVGDPWTASGRAALGSSVGNPAKQKIEYIFGDT